MANKANEKEIQQQVQDIKRTTGFGANKAMTFNEYQKWLAEMNQQNEMSDDQKQQMALSDARTKDFVMRGFSTDRVLKKAIGANMMTTGIIDPKLMGYFLLTGR